MAAVVASAKHSLLMKVSADDNGTGHRFVMKGIGCCRNRRHLTPRFVQSELSSLWQPEKAKCKMHRMPTYFLPG
jgi:hypothetical protein